MKKSWIKVHTGLTNDPKHRETIGVRIWLYLALINHADYETGFVWDYTDSDMASEMGMSINTLRTWRRELEDAKYIRCYPGYQCQHIMIAKWRNPKLLEPPQINVANDMGEYPKVITPPRRKVITLTLDPHSSHDITVPNPRAEYLTLFGFTVSAMEDILLDDLAKEFSNDLLVDGVKEIHKRDVSSIKYMAKMLRGGWRPGVALRKNGKPTDATALRWQALKVLAGTPYTEADIEATIKALQGAA